MWDIDPRLLDLLESEDYDVVMQGITIGHTMGVPVVTMLANTSGKVLGQLFSEYTKDVGLGRDNNNPYWLRATNIFQVKRGYTERHYDSDPFIRRSVPDLKYVLRHHNDMFTQMADGAMKMAVVHVEMDNRNMFGLGDMVRDKLSLPDDD
jgi:hypothetical protein